jgi:hypothetical protein
MSTRSLRRKALPLFLCVGLIAPWASAATPRKARAPQTPAPASFSLVDRAWSFLQSLRGEEGCRLDPSGRCLTGAPQVPRPGTGSDTGCMLDPSGHCQS